MKEFLSRKALEKLVRTIKTDIKSAISSHNHDSSYAAKSHTHTEYASSSHTHSNYASSSHNHDSTYSKTDHTHSGYASSSHNHDTVYTKTGHTHDDRYYTETEMDTKLSGKSDTSHTHSGYAASNHTHSNYASSTHTHDDRYYTETEMNTKIAGLVSAVNDKISVQKTVIAEDNKIARFDISTESGYETSLYTYPSTAKVGSSITIQPGISHSLIYLNIGSNNSSYMYSFLGKMIDYFSSGVTIYGIPLGVQGGGPANCAPLYTLWICNSSSAVTLDTTCTFRIR